MVEMTVLKVQGRLHENPATDINPLALVLGGGQEELPQGHVARVQVHRAESRRSRAFCNFKFQVVGPEFDVHDFGTIYQGLVAEEGPHRGVADFFFVVVGEGKREGFQVQVLFAKTFAEGAADGLYRGGVLCQDPNDNFDFGRFFYSAHTIQFRKRQKEQRKRNNEKRIVIKTFLIFHC